MDTLIPTISYEDDHIAILDKPAGLIVNRADTTTDKPTLQSWVEQNLTFSLDPALDPESDFIIRSGIVHRLDKETSGLIIIAKDNESFVALQAQFKQGRVKKIYKALVHGRVVPEEGSINAPIGRLPWDRMKFGVIPLGRESLTEYRVEQYYQLVLDKIVQELTLVSAFPRTGRTHQIRVHFRYLGFPLFGDSLYAGRKNIKNDRKLLDRHFLHAAQLNFTHPLSSEELEIKSPLPSQLQFVLDQLTRI